MCGWEQMLWRSNDLGPSSLLSSGGPDSGHRREGLSGGTVVDFSGSPLAQITLVPRDHPPVGRGPVEGFLVVGIYCSRIIWQPQP